MAPSVEKSVGVLRRLLCRLGSVNKRFFLFSSALVLTLALIVLGGREHASHRASGLSNFAAPRAAEFAGHAAAKRPEPIGRAPIPREVAVDLRGRDPAPLAGADVRRVLPGITQAISDWRAYRPQKIVIAPYADLPIEFEATSIREEHGRTIWVGRNALPGAFLVAAATENDWHATLVFPPAGAFEVHISGQTVALLEKNHDEDVCGTVPMRALQVRSDIVTQAALSGPAIGTAVTAADTVNTSDVLFFYDADTLSRVQNNAANIESRLIVNIESSNQALVNSGVTNLRWRYLAAYQVPAYTATGKMEDDLDIITGLDSSQRFVANDVSRFVGSKASLHGADQCVLYVGGNRDFAGIAWVPPGSTASSLTLALHTAVVAWSTGSTSYMTLAHELGHNFGCYHDRSTENASDNDGQFHYGHRYVDRSNRDTGTIMSYAIFRVPYYSNPDLSVDGFALGVPEGQPKAANNSRVLRENAQIIASSRASVDAPSITAQPQSVAISPGQSFALSVTASGTNLTYQWKKGGSDLAGATGSTYTKSGATDADAGSYTVTVSNIAGQVTSDSATVSVGSAAPVTPSGNSAPATTPASSGGGGGGGGAVDGGLAVLCSLLFGLRHAWKRRIT
jgi:hypothetical protein